MTQLELAARLQLQGCDISRSGVAKIELGIRQVTDLELIKIAAVLEVPAQWLLDSIGE
jgi:transcriptional regulator with XRE-family HTH domain